MYPDSKCAAPEQHASIEAAPARLSSPHPLPSTRLAPPIGTTHLRPVAIWAQSGPCSSIFFFPAPGARARAGRTTLRAWRHCVWQMFVRTMRARTPREARCITHQSSQTPCIAKAQHRAHNRPHQQRCTPAWTAIVRWRLASLPVCLHPALRARRIVAALAASWWSEGRHSNPARHAKSHKGNAHFCTGSMPEHMGVACSAARAPVLQTR